MEVGEGEGVGERVGFGKDWKLEHDLAFGLG